MWNKMNFLFGLMLISYSQMAMTFVFKRQVQEDGLAILIRTSFLNFGEYLSTGIYELRIPPLDPVKVQRNFDITTKTKSTNFIGKVSNIEIFGFSNLSLSDVYINLETHRVNLNFSLNHTKIIGDYSVNGIFQYFFPIHGQGDFWMEVPLAANVLVKTKIDEEENFLVIDEYDVNFVAGLFRQNFTNLLGGGNIGEVANYFFHRLGRSVLHHLRQFWKKSLGEAIRRKLLVTLRKITVNVPSKRSMLSFLNRDKRATEIFNDYLDKVLENIRRFIISRNLNPIPIENWGNEMFTNGTLSGVDTMHRISDARISLVNNDVTMDIHLQLDNLTAIYNWRAILWLQFWGEVQLDIDRIKIHLIIKIDLLDNPPKVSVENVNTTEVGRIKYQTRGLGPFNVLVDAFVNAFASDFAISFGEILEKPICYITETALSTFLIERY